MREVVSGFCPICNRVTAHVRERFSTGWGCLLTLLTMGLFIPVWILIDLMELSGPPQCQYCGNKLGRGRRPRTPEELARYRAEYASLSTWQKIWRTLWGD